MCRVWLHRILGTKSERFIVSKYSVPLLIEHKILSIGWGYLSSDDFVKSAKYGGLKSIEKMMKEEGVKKQRNTKCLYRFICEMKKGDLVLVPFPKQTNKFSCFSVFELVDDAIYSNESIKDYFLPHLHKSEEDHYLHDSQGNQVDLGFYRDVNPVAIGIPTCGFADKDLAFKFKTYWTNADITCVKQSVINAIDAFKHKK